MIGGESGTTVDPVTTVPSVARTVSVYLRARPNRRAADSATTSYRPVPYDAERPGYLRSCPVNVPSGPWIVTVAPDDRNAFAAVDRIEWIVADVVVHEDTRP